MDTGKVDKNKICLTFDDGLLSQYITAKPILNKYDIKGFWFVYTKTFENNFDISEALNFFVAKHYSNFNEFYDEFEKIFLCMKVNGEVKSF